MNEVTAYQCSFCGTLSLHARYIKGHEKKCFANPELRACKSCRYWRKNHPDLEKIVNGKLISIPFCGHPAEHGLTDNPNYFNDYGGTCGPENYAISDCPYWRGMPTEYEKILFRKFRLPETECEAEL